MPNEVSNYGLEPVISGSLVRARQLQSELFGSVAWKPASDKAVIVVVHKELGSRLHYGLVSSISHDQLSAFLKGKPDVLSTFRDTFLESQEGFGADLIRGMQQAEQELRRSLVMVGFDAKQEVTTVRAFQDGQSVEVPASLANVLLTKKPSDELQKRLAGFRALVDEGDVGCYLLARIEPCISNDESRRRETIELVGLGVLALRGCVIEAPAEKDRLAPIAINAERWMDTSKLATLTLFCERERYYEKAVRQAAQGWMLKWGEKKAIDKQLQALNELDSRLHAVPYVHSQGHAPGPTPNDIKIAWYKMPRYVMPSLGELLVRAEGFNVYELATLARATFLHLHRFFWQETRFDSVTKFQGGAATAVAGAVTAAHGAMEDTGALLGEFVDSAIHGKPIVAFGDLRVLPPLEMIRLHSLWPKLLKGEAELHLLVNKKRLMLGRISGGNGLGALAKKIVTILKSHPGEAWVPAVAGRVHGDAHFENFLVDASIPEDPFIVAIDLPSQKDIGAGWFFSPPSKAGDLMREWDTGLTPGNWSILERTQMDPSYDVAKMLLSATCWFGAVQRGAFVIEDNGHSVWTLTADSASEPQASGNESGGVSGAKVLRLVAPIGPDVWSNHREAAKAILREYMDLLSKTAKASSFPININCAINVSLLRTFFFLIRNAFSIAPRMFRSRPTNAAVMFAMGEHCAFEVDRLLSPKVSLESDDLKNKLVACLADIAEVAG